eukprot:TRINITY_DN5142_c0_g1_i8.p1 TRINITY_DN5142_c0_g1~~TRINITY_DN5142_c0_g1_i8.p1  ORF type:complete len:336 (+),score=53.94 TRINITY_DN5142_c0_g1_i8:752-1759(+)
MDPIPAAGFLRQPIVASYVPTAEMIGQVGGFSPQPLVHPGLLPAAQVRQPSCVQVMPQVVGGPQMLMQQPHHPVVWVPPPPPMATVALQSPAHSLPEALNAEIGAGIPLPSGSAPQIPAASQAPRSASLQDGAQLRSSVSLAKLRTLRITQLVHLAERLGLADADSMESREQLIDAIAGVTGTRGDGFADDESEKAAIADRLGGLPPELAGDEVVRLMVEAELTVQVPRSDLVLTSRAEEHLRSHGHLGWCKKQHLKGKCRFGGRCSFAHVTEAKLEEYRQAAEVASALSKTQESSPEKTASAHPPASPSGDGGESKIPTPPLLHPTPHGFVSGR